VTVLRDQFDTPSRCIIWWSISVLADISTASAQDAITSPPRRHILGVALCVAGIANALVPAVFFSETHLFGQTEPRFRALVAFVVIVEYAIVFLLLLLHANAGFASGYAVATAAIVTLGSTVLAFITVAPAGWDWDALYAEILALGGLAFAVLSNSVFLVTSIRYARAIHPRFHLGGFVLGIGASLALIFLYAHILS
jgi:hypothetical protein